MSESFNLGPTFETLRRIVRDGSAKVGSDFFDSLTVELNAALGANYTFVGTLIGENKDRVRSISLCVDGKIVDDFEYDLLDTPCANVVGNTVCSYPAGVAAQFPQDLLLADMSVDGYVGVPLYDSGQRPLGIVVALYRTPIEDTSLAEMVLQLFADRISNEIERAALNRELEESRAMYQAMIDDMDDYINLFELDGTILFVNRSLARLVGRSAKEIVGTSFYGYVSETTLADLKQRLGALTPDNPLFVHDQETLMPDGSKMYIQWLNRAIFDGDGQLVHFQGVGRDMTEEHRHAEEKLKLQERLHHSEKMLAIGQLAGGVAHDFNNQLSGIVGYADLLLEELGSDPHRRRYVENILVATQRSAELTQQLLAFARKGKFLTKPVDAHAIVAEVIELLAHSIDKRIRVKQELAARSSVVAGDPSQLQNAIMNLALNARDAMPDGGDLLFATRSVTLHHAKVGNEGQELSPGEYLLLEVTDNGVGIPDDARPHVFEPFFTTKEAGKGTGMGLAAVYGAVQNHGGAVEIVTEAGNGTTVQVWLPVSALENEEDRGQSAANASNGKGKGTVLLVDDEQMVLDVATQQLERNGYRVFTCINGEAAVALYMEKWREIDLVILDMVMPVMSGKDAYTEMKRINPNLLALLASGYSIDGEAQGIIDAGVNGFIQKPFRMANLLARIDELIHDE